LSGGREISSKREREGRIKKNNALTKASAHNNRGTTCFNINVMKVLILLLDNSKNIFLASN